MNSLIKVYIENKDKRSLFSEIIYIDYYDGGTQAACKIDKTEEWVLCTLTYFSIEENQRIFAVIEIAGSWVLNLKLSLAKKENEKGYEEIKGEIKNAFEEYSGKAFLLKAQKLEDVNYEIAEVPLTSVKYFNDMEDVLEQDEKSLLHWVGFF